MKNVMIIVGILLMLGGGFILGKGLTYSKKRGGVKIGSFQTSFKTQETVPPWVGGVIAAGGLALLILGLKKQG
jgi:hypothetical protein